VNILLGAITATAEIQVGRQRKNDFVRIRILLVSSFRIRIPPFKARQLLVHFEEELAKTRQIFLSKGI
jgi:hypothetical protein